ncbi:MAG: ubiquinol-cytochrome c reductase iron-sulfur subunit [Deltaproteobacteria bacterium]|nr:ubiquinol-cytochrome c reductase iron-sulfur subunit [Deltaproteobacteria bacterium]
MTEGSTNKATVMEPSRRSFLSKLWIGLGLVALAEAVAVVFTFLRSNKSKPRGVDSHSIVTAGAVSTFEVNSVTAFIRGRFYLARLEDGGFLALSSKCTHLGCTVPWVGKEMKFACPCHGSAYDIAGAVINPPAPRPLDIYPISIENNVVKVDTTKPIKRDQFKVSQVIHP